MAKANHYEDQILKELRSFPEEALPKVLRLIALVREQFLSQEAWEPQQTAVDSNHERTRQLLATSQKNWAQEIIAEREDRL